MVATLDDMLYCINLSLYNFIEQTKDSSMETSEIKVTARAIDLMLCDIVVDGVNVVEQEDAASFLIWMIDNPNAVNSDQTTLSTCAGLSIGGYSKRRGSKTMIVIDMDNWQFINVADWSTALGGSECNLQLI